MKHEPQSTEFDIKLEVEQEGGGELVQNSACLEVCDTCISVQAGQENLQ